MASTGPAVMTGAVRGGYFGWTRRPVIRAVEMRTYSGRDPSAHGRVARTERRELIVILDEFGFTDDEDTPAPLQEVVQLVYLERDPLITDRAGHDVVGGRAKHDVAVVHDVVHRQPRTVGPTNPRRPTLFALSSSRHSSSVSTSTVRVPCLPGL